MKYLKIEAKRGYFKRGEEFIEIDQITAADLHNLINFAYEADFEIDTYNEVELPNKAQQIIYENIYLKLTDFLADKEQFNERANSLYANAVGKYGADVEVELDLEVDDVDHPEKEEILEEDINSENVSF